MLPPGPGAAFERIAERAEVLRKPGDGRCADVDVDDAVADDRPATSSRGPTSCGAATRSATADADAATRAITCELGGMEGGTREWKGIEREKEFESEEAMIHNRHSREDTRRERQRESRRGGPIAYRDPRGAHEGEAGMRIL